MSHPKKNSRRFSQFLSQLLSANTDRFMILVLDNATYHRTAGVLDILTEHEHHVFVVWLPKYSPELNAIEGLWGYLKSSALNNYFYGDMESLKAAVDDAFKELQQHPEWSLLKQRLMMLLKNYSNIPRQRCLWRTKHQKTYVKPLSVTNRIFPYVGLSEIVHKSIIDRNDIDLAIWLNL